MYRVQDDGTSSALPRDLVEDFSKRCCVTPHASQTIRNAFWTVPHLDGVFAKAHIPSLLLKLTKKAHVAGGTRMSAREGAASLHTAHVRRVGSFGGYHELTADCQGLRD